MKKFLDKYLTNRGKIALLGQIVSLGFVIFLSTQDGMVYRPLFFFLSAVVALVSLIAYVESDFHESLFVYQEDIFDQIKQILIWAAPVFVIALIVGFFFSAPGKMVDADIEKYCIEKQIDRDYFQIRVFTKYGEIEMKASGGEVQDIEDGEVKRVLVETFVGKVLSPSMRTRLPILLKNYPFLDKRKCEK